MSRGQELSEEVVEDSSEDESPTPDQISKPGTGSNASQAESETDSETESETSQSISDRESSTSSATRPSPPSPKRIRDSQSSNQQPSNKRAKTSQSEAVRIPAKTFEPPPGYVAVPSQASNSVRELDNMFDDLENKQIWHISAPATVPITSLKSIDMQSALRGETILEHNGVKYNMRRKEAPNEVLLRTTGESSDYSASSAAISRNFCLVAMESADPESTYAETNDPDAISFFAHETGIRPPPRAQPEGLRMRYMPYGTNAEIMDIEGAEVVETPISKIKKPKHKHKRSKDMGDDGTSQSKVVERSSPVKSSQDHKSEKKKKRKEKTTV